MHILRKPSIEKEDKDSLESFVITGFSFVSTGVLPSEKIPGCTKWEYFTLSVPI